MWFWKSNFFGAIFWWIKFRQTRNNTFTVLFYEHYKLVFPGFVNIFWSGTENWEVPKFNEQDQRENIRHKGFYVRIINYFSVLDLWISFSSLFAVIWRHQFQNFHRGQNIFILNNPTYVWMTDFLLTNFNILALNFLLHLKYNQTISCSD